MITATATLTEPISVVAELVGSIVTTCADATVTVNSIPFGTAPSGGGLNVPVVNGGSNPVGAIQAGQFVIGNNATFINTVQVTDQEAEVDANIAVELDGNPSGSWNAMTQTWEVTSSPCASANLEINGVQQETIASGATFNLIATLDGVAGGSYNSGTNTLSFTSNTDWQRDPNWMAMPDVDASDEVFYGLMLVFEDGHNQVSLVVAGTTTIDFGDGTAPIAGTGAVQTYVYDYAAMAGPVNAYQPYPDVPARNYKQAMFTITGTITGLNFRQSPALNTSGTNHFVDINMSIPNRVGNSFRLSGTLGIRNMNICERVRIWNWGAFAYLLTATFDGMAALRVLTFPSNVGDASAAFYHLQSCDLGDVITTATTLEGAFRSFSQILYGPRSVGNIVANSLSGGNGFHNAFRLNANIRYIGNISSTAASPRMDETFRDCTNLTWVGTIDVPLVTNINQAFRGCLLLRQVIFTDCSNVTAALTPFIEMPSLVNLVLPGMRRGVSVAGSSMGLAGTSNFANSLGTALGSQDVTVTGTPFGALLAAADATAVAIAAVITGKGFGIIN